MNKDEYKLWQDAIKEIRDLRKSHTELTDKIQDCRREVLVLEGLQTDIGKKIDNLYIKVDEKLDGDE